MTVFPPETDETPIDRLLRRQQTLDTPVARFSKEQAELEAPRFRELIPLTAPAPGRQYAFEVDLDKCTGCKACVAACHSLNGLDEEETWRDVGLLHGGTAREPYLQTVTTACHHCTDPACLNGCPVNAYEKDPATGIVSHLDDQCIGCQYCVLKCPYEVPKYSKSLGIVRKCDMCHGRLAEGEAPACVQACPNEAIRITTVDTAEEAARHRNSASGGSTFLPGTVDPGYTVPTTRYTGRPVPADARAADADTPRPEHAHWPLVLMLVLTQGSVGVLAAALAMVDPLPALALSAGLCLVGLKASLFHLGKPFKAWRAFLGLTHSWLSREIIVFGAYFPLLLGALLLASPPAAWIPFAPPGFVFPATMGAALAAGLAGVFCSAMIYHDTRRPFWKLHRSAAKFFGTAWILGAAGALVVAPSLPAALLLIAGTLAKLACEARHFHPDALGPDKPAVGSTRVILCCLLRVHANRLLLGAAGGILLPLLFLAGAVPAAVAAVLAFGLCLSAETTERYLYLRAVVPFKMPGGIAS
ncbi:MAG: dimethyl sulfoxide reductase anchor subunit [Opitutales bacterium]|nr:dimethyl sulfoxide reductase anchor subunit [Opitutales bacterium]